MSNYYRIIDQCPDGATLGDSSNAKWAAHGATPCGQQTAPSALTGASDSTAIATAVNLIRTALLNKGIVV